MTRPPHTPRAGGMPIAFGIMVGVVGGALAGQATIGFFAGLGLGIAIAVVIWRRDRRL